MDPEGITRLLAMARERLSEGKPALALQSVVMALRATGGEEAVLQTLARARDVYTNERITNAAADDLATLLAECAIAEATPSPSLGQSQQFLGQSQLTLGQSQPSLGQSQLSVGQSQLPLGHAVSVNQRQDDDMEFDESEYRSHPGAPILAESGRVQILSDAWSDGSSFICLRCGALVSNLRKDEHIAYWCANAPS